MQIYILDYVQTQDEDSEAEKMSPLLDSEKSIEKKVEYLQPVIESQKFIIFHIY